MAFSSKQFKYKTPSWLIGLIAFFLAFVPFLIVWVLIGEFNVLNQNWFVAKGSTIFSGTISGSDEINYINDTYGKFLIDPISESSLRAAGWQSGDSVTIFATIAYFDWRIIIIMLAIIIGSIAFILLLKLLKVCYYDVLPFTITIAFSMTAIITTGMIPIWDQDMKALIWIIRFIIMLLVALVTILAANVLVMNLVASSTCGNLFFQELIEEQKKAQPFRDDLRRSLESINKNDQEYIEIEEKK